MLTFTLQDILDLLPYEIVKDGKSYFLSIEKTVDYKNQYKYYISYSYVDEDDYIPYILMDTLSTNIMNASYEMLCWIAEGGSYK